MKLETLQLNKLSPAEYNPRTISKDEFEGLKTSLQTFGQQENLIVNKDMTIISGHQRYNAMKALGWTEAVCNLVDLDKHEEKKLNVIMNSTVISGKYDDLKLAEILEELKLDDDYTSLRLNELEPLDLSMADNDDLESPKDFIIKISFKEQNELENMLTEISGISERYKCNVSVNSD